MSELEFRKQLLINEFKSMSKRQNKDEILPLMLAISSKAKIGRHLLYKRRYAAYYRPS